MLLKEFYKASKQIFDNDPTLKERAQKAVFSLQGGEEKYRKAWSQICEISRRGYERIYQRLGVQLEEKGESFYNPYIPGALKLLNEKGLIEENEGACVIFIEGKNMPLIVVKKDGGYNYASTDLASLWYRLNEEKAEWIIYVTDIGQREPFEMVFPVQKSDNASLCTLCRSSLRNDFPEETEDYLNRYKSLILKCNSLGMKFLLW